MNCLAQQDGQYKERGCFFHVISFLNLLLLIAPHNGLFWYFNLATGQYFNLEFKLLNPEPRFCYNCNQSVSFAYHRVTLKLRTMKKLFALLSVSLLFLTLIFKSLDFPGTAQLMILTFAFSFPIFFILDFIGEWKSGASKLLSSVYFVAILALSQGLFYKLMHWPGSDQLLILSLIFMLPVYFLLSAVLRNKKDGLPRFSFILFIFLSWTSLFVIMHYPGTVIFLTTTLIIAMFVVIYELVKKEGQPIFQLVQHRHLVNASGFIAFLLFFQANRLPIRVLESEMSRQFSLQEQIAQEIEIGNSFMKPSNKVFSAQVDKETMELLAKIDEVKLT